MARGRVPSRIVVGVSGSAASVAALRWAAAEAALRGAELHAVHVWEDRHRLLAPYAPLSGVPSVAESRESASRLLADSVRDVLGHRPVVQVVMEVAGGLAARVLLDRAAGADLLVLGQRGPQSSAPAEPGPMSRACLRGSPCPVVIAEDDSSSGCAVGRSSSPS
jgi:nucleotide-binding universal stress UspA family protein